MRSQLCPLFLTAVLLATSALAATPPKPGDADFPTQIPSDRHKQKVDAVKSGNYDLVLIGDSITHTIGELGGKYEPLKAVWEKHFAPRHALNLGHNGYRTENILWNLLNGELDFPGSPKVFMILIGSNNTDDRHFTRVHTPEQILAGTKAIVDLIRQRHPTSKILVLRIFPRGGDDEKSASPPAFNSSPQCIETCRRAGGLTAQLGDGQHVFWLDVNYVFLRPDGTINTDLMWDLLHPSPPGAEAWVQAVEPTLAQLLGDKPIVADQPNTAVVSVPKLEQDGYDWFDRHDEVLRIKDPLDPDLVFIGDSITHAWGGVPETGARRTGEKVLKTAFARHRVLNLGFGWDRTQNVLWRLDHGELDGLHPEAVVINIGSNNTSETPNARQNTPAEIAEGIRQIVIRVRAKAPRAKIILMAAFPREEKPDHWRRTHISQINRLLATDFGAVRGTNWVDIGPKLLQPDGTISRDVMGDFCHPTERGYQIWAEAITPLLDGGNQGPVIQREAPPSWPEEKIDNWRGYKRHLFTVDGCQAWVVEPKQPATGRPWTWCMEFPDAFTERTGVPQLLENGFYHLHIVVGDTFGCPAALKHFDAFYQAVAAQGLAKKGTLIGISRGGLYAYNWTALNPDKVVCVYGDAPVCDFKSWPGGKGKGQGSPQDWTKLIKDYGFKDEAEALASKQNPIDELAPLARARIPLIHVVGDADDVVPVAENTRILEERYKALGGDISVIHKPGVGHHPHGLDDPSPLVKFILERTSAALSLSAAPSLPAMANTSAALAARQPPGPWEMGPFSKHPAPILAPTPASRFQCPVLGKEVRWEEQNVYNPAAVVRQGKVFLLYRADDKNPTLKWGRTCRIGLAYSEDGTNLTRHPTPVLYPDNDDFKQYEWEGGCEDLHIVEGDNGVYYLNYTTWSGSRDTMSVATSSDLTHWTKHGPAFRKAGRIGGRSGVVISQLVDNHLVALRVNGKYWMYYTHPCALAWSDNLVDWTPADKAVWPGGGREAGAIALLRDDGILLMTQGGHHSLGAWVLRQALIDHNDLKTIVKEEKAPFLHPEYDWEKNGFTGDTTVANTLVPFKGKWMLYYGAADRCIGLAVFTPDSNSPFSLSK